MDQTTTSRASRSAIRTNKVKTFFSKPHNVILLLMGLVLTVTTVAPIIAIVEDTFKIHAGTIDAYLTGQSSGYTAVNYIDLFTSSMARSNLWNPLLNTVWLAVGTCVVSILFGGLYILNIYLPTGAQMAVKELYKMLPYVITLIVLIIVSLRKKREDQPPASLGLSYFREER